MFLDTRPSGGLRALSVKNLGMVASLPRAFAGNSLIRRFGMGAVWSFIGAVLPQVSLLASYIVVARILGRNVFGEFGMVQTTAVTLTLVSTGSLSLGMTKHVSAAKRGDPEVAGKIIGFYLFGSMVLGFVGFLALYFCGPLLASRSLNAPQLAGDLQLAGVLLWVNVLNGIQVGALFGFESYQLNAQMSVFRGILLCPFLIAGAHYWRLSGALLGLIVSGAICCAVNHFALEHECRKWGVVIRYRGWTSQHHLLWGFSLPAALSGALVMSANWLGSAALTQQPDGYAELGVFNAANHWRLAVAFVPTVLGQSAMPILSELFASCDLTRYRRLMLTNLALSAACSLAVALPVMLFSAFIMVAYGPAFLSGRPVLVLLVISGILGACCQAVGHVLTTSGRMWPSFGFSCAWTLVFIAVLWQGVPRWGAVGLASAYVISYIVHALLLLAYTLPLLRTKTQERRVASSTQLASNLVSGPAN
jgi:O-antigen/teichoic acid export membrane protein